jgi:hypothetical protein
MSPFEPLTLYTHTVCMESAAIELEFTLINVVFLTPLRELFIVILSIF